MKANDPVKVPPDDARVKLPRQIDLRKVYVSVRQLGAFQQTKARRKPN
jgi:hypothetical protein